MNTSLMRGGAPLLCGASPGCWGHLRPPFSLPLAPVASTVRVVPAWAGLGGRAILKQPRSCNWGQDPEMGTVLPHRPPANSW